MIQGGYRLRVEPAGVDISVTSQQTVLEAAQAAGMRWPTVCNGGGVCMTCHFIIRGAEEHFSSQPESDNVKKALGMIRRRYGDTPADHVRLACQTTLTGDAVAFCPKARAGG